MSTLQQFHLNGQNIKIKPVSTNIYRKIMCPIGSKVMYSGDRGSYSFGYYLGLDNQDNAVCVLSSWRDPSFSRIAPHRVLPLEWESYHLNDIKQERLLKDILDDYRLKI